MEQITVAILGLGPRGYHTYAQYQKIHPETMCVVAIADIDRKKIESAKADLGIDESRCYSSAEALLAEDKMADVLIVATQDHQHIAHAMAGLKKGYDLILEKPIATTYKDCLQIREEAKRLKRRVAVCHVLRYTAFYRTIKQVLESGKVGEIVNIDAVENVGYWHQAHSFVRGNWNDSEKSSPMILAKCCHDLDILNFLIGKKCEKVSSYGGLKFFNKANRPEGAAKYCLQCKYADSCPYSAKRIYLAPDAEENRKWFCYVVAPEGDRKDLENALKTGNYGRCVFDSDNNVVDHQVVAMEYENNVTATLTMSAFSADIYRSIRIMCTRGEIEGSQHTNIIRVTPFGEEPQYYDINRLAADLSGHGGGDNQMMTDFFAQIKSGCGNVSSSIENSVESHAMAFAAEESRVRGGEKIEIECFEKENI